HGGGPPVLLLSALAVHAIRARCLASTIAAVALCAMTLAGPPVARASAFSLGAVTATSQEPSSCPTGFQCSGYTVSACPGVAADITAYVASAAPTAPVRGLAVFFSGNLGTFWWDGNTPSLATFMSSLRQAGMETVEVEWS